MKDYLTGALLVVLFAAVFVLAIWRATSAEVWYAGEHTAGCDGTDNCGCYERLVDGEAE